MSRLWKYFLCLTAVCLIELLPLHAATGSETGYLKLKYPTLVNAIYQKQPDKRFWQDQSLRYELEKQIVLFVFADLNDDLLASYRALRAAAAQHNWPRYERIASDLLLFYISYNEQLSRKGHYWLFRGRIGNHIGSPSNNAINAFFQAPSIQERLEYLRSLQPSSPQYERLYKNLLVLCLDDNIKAAKYTAFADEGVILKQKEVLLSRLQISGEISAKMKAYFASEEQGVYSRELKEVIVSFQKRHGLKADGIIGRETRYWLNLNHQQRIRLIALNMLRLGLWEINKPQTIFVNIPGFRMEYWENGENIFESKVIVGRTDRRTPLFSTRLDSIVFNPAWHVPISIMRKDILPVVLSDRNFLKRHRYEILANWHSKRVIDPNRINWSAITVNNFPYKLRQKPGETNALGLYKFNTPNKYAIYLHDTPAKHLFEKPSRAFSSGCIRVHKAEQFVKLLMQRSGYTSEDFIRHHTQQETSVVALKKAITVYTTYQTVWVDDSGLMQFRKDIYNYDK